VVDDSREDGVTDEALFRLAILKINDGDVGGGKSSLDLLDRLRSSYPKSVWTKQAAPLHAYFHSGKNRVREKELNYLREKNLSLSKDVRDLRSVIDRLKALDLELEQKIRR
ncbi:MAG: tetratricopeptide repeat protein, partial [Desulfuromonadaceae bacterium]|nr:tetratricopeptide repeat protein [Desulfuromonadaceae bacterium]